MEYVWVDPVSGEGLTTLGLAEDGCRVRVSFYLPVSVV